MGNTAEAFAGAPHASTQPMAPRGGTPGPRPNLRPSSRPNGPPGPRTSPTGGPRCRWISLSNSARCTRRPG
jgi:hypothetical protein